VHEALRQSQSWGNVAQGPVVIPNRLSVIVIKDCARGWVDESG